MSSKNDGFIDFVMDQLADLSHVTARAMFGGHGLYSQSIFFGILRKDRVYFKVTAATTHRYKDHGMKPFRPNAKQTLTSFYEVPIDILEDAEAMTQWATDAIER
jgi:DNA transformation protein and related proteins